MVTQNGLVRMLAEKTGFTIKDTKSVMEGLNDCILECLKDKEEVYICRFLKLGAKTTPEHKGRNPRTGEEITIPEKFRCYAKFGKEAKRAVN